MALATTQRLFGDVPPGGFGGTARECAHEAPTAGFGDFCRRHESAGSYNDHR